MTIVFPRPLADLADRLPIAEVAWSLMRSEAVATTGGGELIAVDLAPPLWQAEVRTDIVSHAEAEQLRARFLALDGSNQRFYLWNPLARAPQADPGGALVSAATVVIDTIDAGRAALALSGLPASYVITIGDYLAVDYGDPARRALLQAAESAVADGAGLTPEFEVRPHIRAGITAALGVTLVNPAAKVKLLPNSLSLALTSNAASRLAFAARQTLAAG